VVQGEHHNLNLSPSYFQVFVDELGVVDDFDGLAVDRSESEDGVGTAVVAELAELDSPPLDKAGQQLRCLALVAFDVAHLRSVAALAAGVAESALRLAGGSYWQSLAGAGFASADLDLFLVLGLVLGECASE
jgi:hypothetical protein